jgi:hypothetical protein
MTKRRVLLFVTAPLLVITVACIFLFQNAARERAAQDEDIARSRSNSGSQFEIDGRTVNAKISGLDDQIKLGNASDIELRLDTIALPGTAGLGNELDGTLSPSLGVTGCSVTSIQADPKATNSPIAAFDWHWGVVCSSAGEQDLQLTLAFKQTPGPPNGSDPIAYEYSQKVIVYDSALPLDEILKVLSVVGGLVTVISGVIGILRSPNSGTRSPVET